MKKQFLFLLLLGLLCSVGNVWGAPTSTHTPGIYEKSTELGGYGQSLTTFSDRQYEVYGFSSTGSSANYVWAGTTTTSSSAANCVLSFETTTEKTNGWISNYVNGRASSYASVSSSGEFNGMGTTGAYQMNYRSNSKLTIKVSGYDQFSICAKDANTTDKHFVVKVDGDEQEMTYSTNNAIVRRFDISTDEHTIEVTATGTSNNVLWGFSLRIPPAPSVPTAPTINVSGAPENAIVTGTAVTLTAEVTGNPAPTIQWYSNTTASNTNGTIIAGATELTYSPSTATPGTYYFYAVATNTTTQENNVASAVQTIVVKDKVATPTFTPNGALFDGESQSVSIACGTDGATIQYSTDGGSNWTNYTAAFNVTATTTIKAKATKDGSFDSDEASATFMKIAFVSEETTWDWDDITQGEVDLSGYSSIYRKDVVFSDISQYVTITASDDFKQDKIIVNADYAVRTQKISNTNYKLTQGQAIKFHTTIPGTIEVDFSNTGGNRPYRYLCVNGIQTEFKSNVSSAITNATGIHVSAGDVALTCIIDPESSDASAGQASFLRFYRVKFTPDASVTVSPVGYATYVNNDYDLNFTGKSIKAYSVSGISGSTLELTQLNNVKAGTPVILAYEGGKTESIPVMTGAAAAGTNLLVAGTGAEVVSAGNNHYYVLAKQNNVVGFYELTSSTPVPTGKAYLAITAGEAPSIIRFVDEENNATNINNVDASEEAVKFIQDGKFYIKKNGIVYDALGRVIR